MAAVEILCEFGPLANQCERAAALAADASALVDQGRLFFPNVETDNLVGEDKGRGWRVAILDEVVRAYYVAKLAASEPQADLTDLKSQVRAARRRFVKHLQAEMAASLTESSRDKIGVSVSPDPRTWPSDELAAA